MFDGRLVAKKSRPDFVFTKDIAVHHIDGNRKNNLAENLMLMDRSEHLRFHHLKRHPYWQRKDNLPKTSLILPYDLWLEFQMLCIEEGATAPKKIRQLVIKAVRNKDIVKK